MFTLLLQIQNQFTPPLQWDNGSIVFTLKLPGDRSSGKGQTGGRSGWFYNLIEWSALNLRRAENTSAEQHEGGRRHLAQHSGDSCVPRGLASPSGKSPVSIVSCFADGIAYSRPGNVAPLEFAAGKTLSTIKTSGASPQLFYNGSSKRSAVDARSMRAFTAFTADSPPPTRRTLVAAQLLN